MRRALAILGGVVACNPPIVPEPDAPPLNIVLVLADDMRRDALFAMPYVEELDGVRFTRAYIPNPMCCPARVSLLSGGYDSHEAGVLTNDAPNGGAGAFIDGDTLGTRLQAAGYTTGYVGKYLNHYNDLAPYVPPGWTSFHGMLGGRTYLGWEAVEGGTGSAPGTGDLVSGDEYLTDRHRDASLAFLDAHAEGPFFLFLSAYAPHAPWEPAPEDEGAFAGLEWREGAFNEADTSDKPAAVQLEPVWDATKILNEDLDVQRQLESLRSLDRAVAAVVSRLETLGVADRTVVVFTSDNGLMWGEHRLRGKGWMYEESVRVPLIVQWPGVTARDDDRLVAANLDVAATIAEIAGLPAVGDGASLAPVIAGADPEWREALLLENYTRDRPLVAGAVSRDHKALLHIDGTWEVYDLVADPFEETASPTVPPAAEPLRALVEAERGLLLVTQRVDLSPGVAVDVQLETWGGVAPFQFRRIGGPLPDGLELLSDGRLVGELADVGQHAIEVEVTDASVSRFHGGPQRYASLILVSVGGAARSAPDVEVRATARSARVHVALDRPARVLVEVAADPTFDAALRLGPFAADGAVVVPVEGLVPDRRYHVRVSVDGVPIAATTFRTTP